MDMFSKSNHIN